MRILLTILFVSIVSYAKISSAIQNVGTVSITDIAPNVAVKGAGSSIVIKGSGFTQNTKVIITADTTHEVLMGQRYSLPSGLAAQDSYVYGDKLYVGYGDDSESYAGILVYDLVSNSNKPELLHNNNDINLTYVNSMRMIDNSLYVADDSGLFKYNVENNGTLTNAGIYPTSKIVRKIQSTSDSIIISTGNASNLEDDNTTGIIVLNNFLEKQSDFNTTGSSWSFDISGTNLFIADGDNGLLVTDMSGAEQGRYDTSSVHDIVVDGDYAYLAKFSDGIEVVNVSDLSSIVSEGNYTTNSKSHKIKLENNKLIVTNTNNGVLVLDVADKTNIKKFANFSVSGSTFGVDTYGEYGYIANGFNGLIISNISKPNSMDNMILSSQVTNGYSNSVTVDGNTSYFTYSLLGETNGGVVVTDLSKLEQPKYRTSFRQLHKTINNTANLTLTKFSDLNVTNKEAINLQTVTFDGDNNRTMTTANQVFVQDGLAYVADAYGLIIYDVDNNVSLGNYPTYNIYYDGKDENNDSIWSSSKSNAKSVQVVYDLNISGDIYPKVAIVSNDYGSVALFDVNNSSVIQPIANNQGFLDILTGIYGTSYDTSYFDQFYSTNSIVKDGILYIGTFQKEIIKIDLSTLDWEEIEYDSNALKKSQINSITFNNNYAYISAGYDGILITPDNNLSDVIGSYDTPDFAWFTSIKDNIAYIADSYTGIVMLDITDPTNPTYLETLKVSGDTRDLDFIDSQSALLASSNFAGVSTLDKYFDTNVTFVDENTLNITFPDYRILGDYNIKVKNDDGNYSRVASAITLISQNENTTMAEVQNDLQLRTKDGKDGEVVVDAQSMVILNALLSYSSNGNSTITNVFKELTTAEYQMTSSDKSIAQIYGNKVVFYNNGKVTITISAKGLTDSITFTVKNIEPITVENEANTDKLTDAQAVIIVGHIDSDNLLSGLTVTNSVDKLRFSINKIGNKIYKTLIKFGIDSSDIFYFNPNGAQKILDIDNDKKKDDVTYNNTNFSWDDVTTLVNSLENNSSRPLIFYMVDHGDVNEIKVAANKSVSATNIKTLFDDFQTNTNRKIVGVFDACYSGSIFDDLNNDSNGSRVIISSADASHPTYMDPFGISFSKYFTKYMLKGDDLNASFSKAGKKFNKKLKKYGVSINPQYYSSSLNKQKISDYAITSGEPDFNDYTAKDVNETYVVTNSKTLTLDVNVTLNYPSIAKAYALILPPKPPENVGTAKVIDSQKVTLNYNTTTKLFSGDYTFDTNGTYAINYLVEDDEDNMLLSDLVYVTIDKSATLSVASTKDNLTNSSILNNNTDLTAVTTDLNLSTIGVNSVTVSWESNDTSVININGSVTRPVFSNGNKTVTLTATMVSSDGSVTDTKVFTVVVVATNNNIPKVPNYTYKVKSGDIITGQLIASDIDGDNILYTIVYNDLNGTLNLDNNGSFTYTSNSDFIGFDSFTFYTTDGIENSSTKTVTFIVSSNKTATVSTNITKYLQNGWNLIGVESISMLNNAGIDYAFSYDTNWSIYTNSTNISSYPSFSSISNNKGYWVKTNSSTQFTYTTTPTTLDISTLKNGWNLVSSKEITDMDSMFKSTDIKTIWRWQNNNWEFYSSKAELTSTAIKAGYKAINHINNFDGFWIYK